MLNIDDWQKSYDESKIISPTIAIQENYGASLSVYFYQANQALINDKYLFFTACFKDFYAREYSEDCQNFAEIQQDLAKLNINQITQFDVKNTINLSSAGRLEFYLNQTDIFADLLHNVQNCTAYFDSDLQKFIVLQTPTHFYAISYLIS